MDILSGYKIWNAASSLWDKCWLSIQWWPGWPRFPHQPQSERLYIKSNPAGPSSLCVAYHIQLESGLHCILYFVQDGVLANTLKICAKNSLHHHPAVTAHVWTGTHKKFHCKCHKQLSFRSNKQQLPIINVYCVIHMYHQTGKCLLLLQCNTLTQFPTCFHPSHTGWGLVYCISGYPRVSKYLSLCFFTLKAFN